MVEIADSVTMQRDQRGEGARRTLLVLGPGFQTSVPLGSSGRVTIGRASDNLVEIDEPDISRHHLVLHLGAEVTLEDLGSSNGTRVGGVAIAPGTRMPLPAGVPVELGSTMLVVQDRAIASGPRRLWPWDYFEARIEEECRRALRQGACFSILHLRCEQRTAAPALERRLAALLPRLDVVARYVPGEYEVLLVGTQARELEAEIRTLVAALVDHGVALTLGHARFPDDGREPDSLVAAASLRAQHGEAFAAGDEGASLVSASNAMHELVRTIERLAPDTMPMLIVGETGTGKELVAQEIHRRSARTGALVRLDGAGEGSLDPAAEPIRALLGQRGATLLVDEVCELSPARQAELVRLLETVERMHDEAADAPRVLATTRYDIEAAVASGQLRIDLFHRLDGVTLVVPPLRSRREDLAPLVDEFVAQACARLSREPPVIGEAVLARLAAYRWPGNVRELRNVVRRAVLLADGPVLLPTHLPLEKLGGAFSEAIAEVDAVDHVRAQFESLERERIVEALARAGGNQTEAAKLLGISRRTLVKRLDLYDLPRPRKK
ncbi:MAG: sigma 54-interacting transcriptional regulator [Nannocystaceae bacterium]|nr:sigma 54-interacting transcriptional regulator [Nannocystaceae bacterium]